MTYTYDRRGRQSVVVQGSMTTTRTYDDLNQLTGESYSGGVLNGLVVTNTYDSLTRRSEVSAKNGGTPLQTTSFGYDSASRMTNVTDGTYSAGYAYLANSALIQQVTFKQSSTVRMTTARQYDFLNRLQGITSAPGAAGTVPIAFGYQYNGANQRSRMTLADGSYWVYEYDALGQVISGKRYWNDGTPVAGQQYEYGFDDIGNRTGTKAGGNAMGTGLRSATYTTNTKNQYSSRTVPNAVDVLGLADAGATVLVNDSPADYRKGEYWQELLGINNSSAAQYVSVTNKAVLGGSTDTVTGNVFLPQTPENYTYDTDGNTTEDGRWTYTWDGENRLLSLTSLSSNPSGSRRKLEFQYDAQGRRIQKLVSVWNGSAYVAQSTNRFLYDGWNLIAELNGYNAVLRTYLWGLDLSGMEQGAGGVRGLVAIKPSGGNTLFAAFDGNGNVAALVDGTMGTVTARYEYGPFGEAIRVSGSAAGSNPFRFSTKYEDPESDLLYYGFRYYSPSTGRWPNRDPIGAQGGANGYAFVRNSPVGKIDLVGLLPASVHSIEYSGHGSAEKNGTSWQYVTVDDAINKGQVPLNITDTKPAASVTATLDDGFNARIVAWTALSRDSDITALQMSTDLSGTIKVCCPCPFQKVRANWSVAAALSGTVGIAHARFDHENEAITTWNRPNATVSGVKDKTLDTSSYCTTFSFVMGQVWTDVSRTTPTTANVRVQARFECLD